MFLFSLFYASLLFARVSRFVYSFLSSLWRGAPHQRPKLSNYAPVLQHEQNDSEHAELLQGPASTPSSPHVKDTSDHHSEEPISTSAGPPAARKSNETPINSAAEGEEEYDDDDDGNDNDNDNDEDETSSDPIIDPARLCHHCVTLTLSSLTSPTGHPFHPTWRAVERSATRGGCPLCAALTDWGVWIGVADGRLYPMVRFPGLDVRVPEAVRERLARLVRPGRLHAVEVFEGAGKGLVGRAEEVDGVGGGEVFWYKGLGLGEEKGCEEMARRYGIPVRRRLTYTGSVASFGAARRWLAACDAEHGCCSSRAAAGTYPKVPASRLLDVEAFEKPCPDIKLVETGREHNVTKYIALSYRWGTSGRRFITTRATFQERCNRIPFTSLPLTFKHAVQTARELGVRYIWIDSLCIIQDDSNDWAVESAQMGAIYAQSYVTLAADSGKSSDGGLFNAKSVLQDEEPMGKHVLLRVPAQEGEGEVQTLYVSDERNVLSNLGPQEMFAIAEGDDVDDPDRMLVTRGWTLQEAILAPRVLHYTSKQLIWECPSRGYQAEDIFSINLRYTRPTHTEVKSLLQVLGPGQEEDDQQTPKQTLRDRQLEILKAWYIELIELRYATRRLTYEEDKLPAIAGLASFTAPALDCPYVAGMWRKEIEWALTWRTVESEAATITTEDGCPSETTREKSRPYRSPSFSWASSYGQVSWDYALETFQPTAHVDDIHVELDCSSLPFGRVREGCWIRITGFLSHFTITPSPGWNSFTFENCGGVKGKIHMDGPDPDASQGKEEGASVAVTCLELGLGSGPGPQSAQSSHEMRRRLCLLVLAPIDGRPGSYTRLGFAGSWDVGSEEYERYAALRDKGAATIY